jgi:tetratricopeptide (TPR) repeat protein
MYNVFAATAPVRDGERYHALAEAAGRKALALDDSLAEAHGTLAASRMRVFDFAAAEGHLTRAIALEPSFALAHQVMVTLQLWTSRPAQALAHAERALALDPLSPTAHAELARALLGNDRCDEALTELAKLAALRPPLMRVAPMTAQCYARKQMWPEAIAVLRAQTGRGDRTALAQLGFILARAGQRDEALRIRATVLESWRRGDGGGFEVALVYAGLGDLDETVTWLERAITDGSLTGLASNPAHLMIMGPLLEDVRRHPGFERVRGRLGVQKR